MARSYGVFLTSAIFFASVLSCLAELKVAYEWKYIDYTWRNVMHDKICWGYNGSKLVPTDVQYLPDGRVLIVTPQYLVPTSVSLATISSKVGEGGPLLEPYPGWEWYNFDDCSGLKSVSKVVLDKCERLWLVDDGTNGEDIPCPPFIISFDTKTDKLISSYLIPESIAKDSPVTAAGRLRILAVETYGKDCGHTWVYIAEVGTDSLLIWDGQKIWRVKEDFFKPSEDGTVLNVAGATLDAKIGIKTAVLSPPYFSQERYLLFIPQGSDGVVARVSELHDSISGTPVRYYGPKFDTTPDPVQGLSLGMSKEGILIKSYTDSTLKCWDTSTSVTNLALLARNETALQFVTTVKFFEEPDWGREVLFVLSNREQKLAEDGSFDITEVNFRVLTADLIDLIKGTPCEIPIAVPADRDLVPLP